MRILFARMVDESTSCFHSLQELGARQQAGIGGSTTTEFFWVTFPGSRGRRGNVYKKRTCRFQFGSSAALRAFKIRWVVIQMIKF
jgi:hypothetical protein